MQRYLFDAFYREVSIKDTLYSRLIEAAIQVDAVGYKKASYDKDELIQKNLRVRLIELRKSDDYREYNLSGLNSPFGEKNEIYEILNDNYLRFLGKKGNHFLNRRFLDSYNYQLLEMTAYNDQVVHHIQLVSKDTNSFYRRNIHFFVSAQDYGIIRIENKILANPHISELKDKAIDGRYFYNSSVDYRKINGMYYPFYIKTNKYASNTDPLPNGKLQYMQLELLITSIDTENYERIKNKNVFSDGQEIYDVDRAYNEDFWQNYNTVKLNPLSKKAKDHLEFESSLEDQFKRNENIRRTKKKEQR